MSERTKMWAALDELPRVKQQLKLICRQCGKRAVYDVGTIFCDQEGEGESAQRHYTFSNYFRCRDCGSPGPWDVADFVRLLGLALRARVDRKFEGLLSGRCALFDGTFIQAPAMGEDYLLKLIEKEPRRAFLCTRLGNLLRSCGEKARSIPWYEKALSLDPGDVEARYHLFLFAVQRADVPEVSMHGSLLVRALLQGRKTEKDELTEGIAFSVAENLRDAPEQFRARFLGPAAQRSNNKEEIFIRTLLEQEGDEKAILEDAAERLLSGQPTPSSAGPAASASEAVESPALDLVPSLRTLVQANALDDQKLTVALQANDQGKIRIEDRHRVPVSDGKKMAFWPVPSMRALFRGNRTPPRDIDHYPPPYCFHFYFIENHLLTLCRVKGDRTDQEMEEIYSTLRRRPDGRSLGEGHDFLWQIAALTLGMYALSEAEFDAMFGQLARSTRKWAQRPVSRNYVSYLRGSLPAD